MRKQLLQTRKAFTLLEILLATGIFMTVMVVSIAIFTVTTGGSATSEQLRRNVQSARYIFETINREIRLSRGLVYADAGGRRTVILPPFRVDTDLANKPIAITVFQVTTVDSGGSESRYNLLGRRYEFGDHDNNSTTPDIFTVWTRKREQQETIGQLNDLYKSGALSDFTAVPAGAWIDVNPGEPRVSLLDSDTEIDKFAITKYQNYTLDPTLLGVQPFIQLELSVQNVRASARRDSRKNRTTLRTMIVPRDFVNRYEAAQQGLQGAGD